MEYYRREKDERRFDGKGNFDVGWAKHMTNTGLESHKIFLASLLYSVLLARSRNLLILLCLI